MERYRPFAGSCPNGWEAVAEAAEQLPEFEKPVLADFMAALRGKPFDESSLEKIAAHADFSRTALEMKGWQSRPWDPPDYFTNQAAPLGDSGDSGFSQGSGW